jgi:pimeloyl-ACP methyl ester carboxylesterase
VALAHGFVGDGCSTWSAQVEALSADFTVVAWDAPGAGRSSDPPAGFGAGDYAECWAAFLEGLGFVRAHLVGLSFGGIVALAAVGRRPRLARSLALVGGYAGWAGSLPAHEVGERLDTCLRVSQFPPDDFAGAMVPSMFSPGTPESRVAPFAASVARFHPAGFRAMARASAEADLRPILPTVDVPTLIVHADLDVRAPREVAESLHSGIASSRLVVLRGVGHVSPVEAPEAVSRELGGFLRSVGRSGEAAATSWT